MPTHRDDLGPMAEPFVKGKKLMGTAFALGNYQRDADDLAPRNSTC